MPLSTGDKLGPYEILSAIGSGGMGEVWKARDSRLDRIVAIKTSREVFSERFEREARAIAALNHPHICQIFDVGPDYLVMEYIEGQEIKGPMTVHQALRSAVQLAGALEAAHRKSITHRDLKPANILNTKTGLKVLDFGLAKFDAPKAPLGDETVTRALTEEGTIVGTLQYMSPEQLQGKPADARSDIFSFGCVLYEILTGNRAFRAENKATLVAAIIDREPEPLTAIQPPLQQTPPPMLERIMRKCLAKDPDDRWQSAADLKSQLEWLLESGSNAGIPQPALEEPHHNHSLGWILAAIFAASLLALAVFHFRTPSTPAPVVRFEIPSPEGTSWAEDSFPVVSPDGSRIVFPAMKRDGTTGLWMRPLNSATSQPISGTFTKTDYGLPTWSPDGRSIAYVVDSTLYTLDLSGGAPQTIASGAYPLRPTWTYAGSLLFHGGAVKGVPPLMQVSASGGDARPIVNNGLNYQNPLPGGQRYVYTKTGISGLFSGTLDSKDEKRLTSGSLGVFVPPHWLLYVRGSALVVQAFDPGSQSLSGDPIPIAEPVPATGGGMGFFSASQTILAYRTVPPSPPNDLTWYTRQGQRLNAVGEAAYYTNPALSPDGKRLAVSRLTDTTTGNRDIWVLDLVRGVSSRFTFDKADHTNPVWSPDGSRIAFSSQATGSSYRGIYAKALGGVASEELLLEYKDMAGISAEDWSPDGKRLLFNVGTHHIEALPITGERKPYPVLKAGFNQLNAAVSPDGRWIAYLSDESGSEEIFVQSFPPSGGKWQISARGGTEPSWRRDGKELYFMSGTKLMAVDVKAAGSTFEAGIPKVLFEPQVPLYTARRNRYVPAPDGQRFLFVTTPVAVDTTPFVVVENWQNSVKLK
jgi:serine/threonine protein kinase